MIERLQTLVSSDGRFRNMRDALHRWDLFSLFCSVQILSMLAIPRSILSFLPPTTPIFYNTLVPCTLLNMSDNRDIHACGQNFKCLPINPWQCVAISIKCQAIGGQCLAAISNILYTVRKHFVKALVFCSPFEYFVLAIGQKNKFI